MKKTQKIGKILTKLFGINPKLITQALQIQENDPNRKIGEILVEEGFIQSRCIYEALASQFRLRIVYPIPEINKEIDDLKNFFDKNFLIRNNIVPFWVCKQNKIIKIAISDPSNSQLLRDIQEQVESYYSVEFFVSLPNEIERFIHLLFPQKSNCCDDSRENSEYSQQIISTVVKKIVDNNGLKATIKTIPDTYYSSEFSVDLSILTKKGLWKSLTYSLEMEDFCKLIHSIKEEGSEKVLSGITICPSDYLTPNGVKSLVVLYGTEERPVIDVYIKEPERRVHFRDLINKIQLELEGIEENVDASGHVIEKSFPDLLSNLYELIDCLKDRKE